MVLRLQYVKYWQRLVFDLFLLTCLCFPIVIGATATTPASQDGVVEMPVNGETQVERQQAFTQGLQGLLVSNANDQDIVNAPLAKEALEQPELYVKQFNYITRNLAPEQDTLYLQIHYDMGAFDKLLKRLAPTNTAVAIQPSKVIIRIEQVDGIYQYHDVVKYLRSLSKLITHIELTRINASGVELTLNIPGGSEALIELLAKQYKLTPNTTSTQAQGVYLDYKWMTVNEEQS